MIYKLEYTIRKEVPIDDYKAKIANDLGKELIHRVSLEVNEGLNGEQHLRGEVAILHMDQVAHIMKTLDIIDFGNPLNRDATNLIRREITKM